jgi:hypothetical protein
MPICYPHLEQSTVDHGGASQISSRRLHAARRASHADPCKDTPYKVHLMSRLLPVFQLIPFHLQRPHHLSIVPWRMGCFATPDPLAQGRSFTPYSLLQRPVARIVPTIFLNFNPPSFLRHELLAVLAPRADLRTPTVRDERDDGQSTGYTGENECAPSHGEVVEQLCSVSCWIMDKGQVGRTGCVRKVKAPPKMFRVKLCAAIADEA